MTRLIDLNQTVFVPVVDESKGGVEYEIKMTLAEFFKKCLPDFEPKLVDAIPTEFLRKKMNEADDDGAWEDVDTISWLIRSWESKQLSEELDEEIGQ